MAFGKWLSGLLQWNSGVAIIASDLNTSIQGTAPPIGSIVAWLKSYTNAISSLPAGFVECNGQTLSDADSPLNGDTIPNLNNASAAGVKYLKGNTTSGGTGGAVTHTHSVDCGTSTNASNSNTSNGPGSPSNHPIVAHNHSGCTLAYVAANNEPPYYDVVFIMRVK
ncbi:Uncharacterised protein [Candidatus Anstonella stagnisolia]|nr:Uncharacterised protein [Candidatus Anstonella stagnisolia]